MLRVVRQRAMQFEQGIKVAIPGLKCGPEEDTFGLGSKKNSLKDLRGLHVLYVL